MTKKRKLYSLICIIIIILVFDFILICLASSDIYEILKTGLCFLGAISYFIIFIFLWTRIDLYYKKKIKSIKVKQEYYSVRLRLYYIHVFIWILFSLSISLLTIPFLVDGVLLKIILVILLTALLLWGYTKILNGLETKPMYKSIDDVLGLEFSLYLRAFEEDDKSLENQKNHSHHFQASYDDFLESEFITLLDDVIAVGQPGQPIPPKGAKRLYFDNNEWKESVEKLIEKANKIIVLISDKPSCIWEIEKLKDYLDKTFFIVRDFSVYKSVCRKLESQIELPYSEENHVPFCFYRDNGQFVRVDFENDPFSYGMMTNIISSF